MQAVGDQRINPYGSAAKLKFRSGLLVQKQPITGPQLHFGLGEQTQAEVVRVVWPNGTVRAEFGVKADMDIITEQRLKASCPFLFAYNGKQMEFVKDAVPWGSAIGLRINTLGSAHIAATGEWYKIGRDSSCRTMATTIYGSPPTVEVYYYDYLALRTVDHPAGTEIFVDERFVIPPLKLGITTVRRHTRSRAPSTTPGKSLLTWLTPSMARRWASFGSWAVPGHHPRSLSRSRPRRRRAEKWATLSDCARVDPRYGVVGECCDHSRQPLRAHGSSLEVPDGHGGWVTAQDDLGFPAGR